MRAWMVLSVFALACGGGRSATPDDQKLSEFEKFTAWGQGMEDHSAPTSSGSGSGSGGDDTGDVVSDLGACMSPEWDDCMETDEASCEAMGWLYYYGYECEDFLGD